MVLAPYLMGIDLGTTTCRCAIFDLHGTEIASAYREIPVRYPRPLWAEVDPETWWSSTVEVVRKALNIAESLILRHDGLEKVFTKSQRGLLFREKVPMGREGHCYVERIATIGCTDAARRAGARAASAAARIAIAAPAT